MGGGRKKDRTKGSTKPSSSARSAELLENSSGLIGFGENNNSSSSILESFVFGEDVPSEFRVVFKKMTKKDEVTRLKAVGEFNELMEETGTVHVTKIIPYWPRMYSKIANDHDRRIRTAAQQAHLNVVKHAGREIAPQLKSLASTWFISCSDPHAPAASLAFKSFSVAFPTDKKLTDAIRFCLTEIIMVLDENLLNSSIQSFKDVNLSAEESENKYFRVVSSSLLAYASLLDYINVEFFQKIKPNQDRILESIKFWKYSKNKNTMIRSSWFKLICKMGEKTSELSIFQEFEYNKLIDITFTNLQETDPIIAPIIWDCCLYIMLNHANWKDSVNVSSTVLPNLLQCFENGCSGNGVDIYPKLLPFLSCLLKEEIPTGSVLKEILCSLRHPYASLKKKQLNALMKSYFELSRYFEKISQKKDIDAKNLVVEDVFIWFEMILIDEEVDSISSDFFTNFLGSYLLYNQSSSYWIKVSEMIKKALSNNRFTALKTVMEAFLGIQSSKNNNKRITFSQTSKEVSSGPAMRFDSSEVNKLGSEICRYCLFENNWDNGARELVTFIICSFGMENNFFEYLMKGYEVCPGRSGVFNFIKKLSLMNKTQITADFIVFASTFLSQPEEILEFHSSIICYESQEEKEWFSLLMLSMTHISDEQIRPSLFKMDLFEKIFISSIQWTIESIINRTQRNCENIWSMIKEVCFKFGKHMSEDLLGNIVTKFLKYIDALYQSQAKDQDISQKGSALVFVSSILETVVLVEDGEVFNQLEVYKELLLSLLRIICNKNSILSDDVHKKVMSSWEVIFKNFLNKESSNTFVVDAFLEDVCKSIKDFLLNLGEITHLTEVAMLILSHITQTQRVRVINKIAYIDTKHVSNDFPSKELLFERKIFPVKVLEMDFIDFENEHSGRKCYLEFFRGLSEEMCSIVGSGCIDEEFVYNLAHLIHYERSLMFDDQGPSCEKTHWKNIFNALSNTEQLKLFNYIMEMSRTKGGVWSLVLDTVNEYSDHSFILTFEKSNQIDLNHREILSQLLTKDKLREICSELSENISNLEVKNIIDDIVLASRLISSVDEFKKFADICFDAIKVKRDEVDFLFSCDISEMNWNQMLPTLAVMEFFDSYLEVVESRSYSIDPERWVFLLCFTSSWIQTIDESRNCFSTKVEVQRFALPLFRLLEKIGMAMNKLSDEVDYKNLKEEWKEFFAGGMYDILLRLFVTISYDEIHHEVTNALNCALKHIPLEILHEGAGLPPKFCEEDVESANEHLPDNYIFLLNHLGPLVLSSNASIQMTAAHLLLRLMSKISELESAKNEREDAKKLPHRIIYLLNYTEPIVKNIFEGFQFGETVTINDAVDKTVTTYLRAYLHTCRLVLQLISSANQELRPSWTEFIRERNFLDSLVPVLFSLMRIDEPAPREYSEFYFIEIHNIAFHIYHDLLKCLPAMFRQWWNLTDNRISGIIEKFTINSISPLLWEEESQNIISSKTTFKNMTVGVRTSVREVVAVYSLDEGSMDLIISLPNNFPLGTVKVDRNQRIGVGHNQWRNWMLQLTTFLQHQNGSILEGLIIWKNNVDKRFEGVEECCICFYILHGANHQLPKLSCRTCKKKFHSACLYKWFSTSNNSTCPMCRNLF
ncbi:E3 ubiquitin-protein ligase listerin [Lepeophtheirus salmonis]|uniref:E3 ubiquitin-protein ligase listerin n=1 Tax=Lepeophtheirus salmonis TaxID=72036 RepID=UPI001AE3F384|nr:E3 ubiquitin-protein ligase listerin-like [Lepeophtheirus salmonis]